MSSISEHECHELILIMPTVLLKLEKGIFQNWRSFSRVLYIQTSGKTKCRSPRSHFRLLRWLDWTKLRKTQFRAWKLLFSGSFLSKIPRGFGHEHVRKLGQGLSEFINFNPSPRLGLGQNINGGFGFKRSPSRTEIPEKVGQVSAQHNVWSVFFDKNVEA